MSETYNGTNQRRGSSNREEKRRIDTEYSDSVEPVSKAQQLVQYVTGLLVAVLSIRFLLALFGANPNNNIVDLLYTVTTPLIVPFRNLFASPSVEVSRFEVETLVAIIAYLIVGAMIVKLIELFRSDI